MPVITRRIAILKGYEPGKWFLQTILINKHKFTRNQAKVWLKNNGFYHKYFREAANYFRAMQTNPVFGGQYITIRANRYIELVYQKF